MSARYGDERIAPSAQKRRTIMKPVSINVLRTVLGAMTMYAFAASAADLAENCANCHGKDGASTESSVPVIGGMSANYIGDALKGYKDSSRYCPETTYKAGDKKGTKTTMCAVAKDLAPTDISALATSFAGKKFVRPAQSPNAALVAKGKDVHDANCEKCHSEGGSVASDDAGILAGQWMPYLAQFFKEVQSGQRQVPKKMKVKTDPLSSADFDALVAYYGSFK